MNQSLRAAQLCSAILTVLLLPNLLRAQGSIGEIRVEVQDPSGAAMQASGRLENLQSGATRSFQTDANGKFTLEELSLGPTQKQVHRLGEIV